MKPLLKRRLAEHSLIFTGLSALIVVGFFASLSFGANDMSFSVLMEALLHPWSGTTESIILYSIRLPRFLIASLVGVSLSIAGAMLQGVLRNPLASPGIIGVNAGASFFFLILAIFFPALPSIYHIPLSFVGACLITLMVYLIASGVGMSPLRLALSGIAVSSMINAISAMIKILFENQAQNAYFALSGSLVGKDWSHFALFLPWAVSGIALAFLLAGKVNLLALNQDIVKSLGVKTLRNQLLISAIAVLLATSAVSLVGPLGFVGLIVPHTARLLVGSNYVLLIPVSGLLGANLMIWADIASRLVNKPFETPVGIIISLIGTPIFIYLARRSSLSQATT